MLRRSVQPRSTARRGAIVPIVAVSLLVIMLGLALVLDRSWLDIAQEETRAAAEAAALAGARALASDAMLKNQTDPQLTKERVGEAVVKIAAENHVAGESVKIVPTEDVQLGRMTYDDDTGKAVFLETDKNPTTVRVTARMTEHRENPVALLMQELTSQPSADVAQQVAATADNRVRGVRPYRGAAVPGIPFAILADDPTNRRRDTWQHQIVLGLGQDLYGYDEKTHQITTGADGIREIVLTGEDPQDKKVLPNVAMVDLGTGLRATGLVSQIQNGWTEKQLKEIGGEILLPTKPQTLSSTARLTLDPLRALASLEGEARICLLYQEQKKEGYSAPGSVTCVGLVAGRVVKVIPSQTKASQIIFQPAVIVTRTVLLPDVEFAPGRRQEAAREWLNTRHNRYLYKTRLTQ